MEQEINIVENGQYKNINLKPKPMKGITGIDNGNYIIVEKVFAEGFENEGKFGKSYSCKVRYKDEECSFWLNEKEHAIYGPLGGVGDLIRISLNKESFVNPKTGVEMLYNKLTFALEE